MSFHVRSTERRNTVKRGAFFVCGVGLDGIMIFVLGNMLRNGGFMEVLTAQDMRGIHVLFHNQIRGIPGECIHVSLSAMLGFHNGVKIAGPCTECFDFHYRHSVKLSWRFCLTSLFLSVISIPCFSLIFNRLPMPESKKMRREREEFKSRDVRTVLAAPPSRVMTPVEKSWGSK